MQQIAQHHRGLGTRLRVLIDLTSLEKCGKFLQLSTPTDDPEHPDPWVRRLNGKRGLHIVVLYLAHRTVACALEFSSLAVGLGHPSPSQLACKLLGTVPVALSQGTAGKSAGRYGVWHCRFSSRSAQAGFPHAVVGMRCNRKLSDGRTLKQLYRNGKRGQQVHKSGHFLPVERLLVLASLALKVNENYAMPVSTYPY